jgi:hypothetical protein
MAFDPITAALDVGGKLIDRLLPDKQANDAAKAELLKMQVQGELDQMTNDIAAMTQVNQTMRAEAGSGHWLQWAWRPIVGMTLALVIVNNYVLLPYMQGFGLKVIDIPDKVWEVMLAVVGVSALTRGLEKSIGIFKAASGDK